MTIAGWSGTLTLAVSLLAARAASGAIMGRVVGEDGTPVAGATVHVYAPETQKESAVRTLAGRARTPAATATTDSEGAFRIGAILPAAAIEVRASGFAPGHDTAAADHPLTVRLKPSRPVRRVVTAGGRPVAGALVVWTGASLVGPAVQVMARTGDDGAYEVSDPAQWAHGGVILHPEFAPRELSRFDLSDDAHRLDPGVAIEGTVVDGARAPIAGATVWVGAWPLARSAADGAFRVDHAPTSWRSVLAREGTRVGRADRSSGHVTVTIRAGASVWGHVRDQDGRPVAGAAVSFTYGDGADAPVLTGSNGEYLVAGLAPGTYRGSAGKPGYASEPIRSHDGREMHLAAADTARRDLVLTRKKVVTGRVVDDAGQPVAQARVTLTADGPSLYAAEDPPRAERGARTSPDGRFEFLIEPPSDIPGRTWEYAVAVLKEGYAAARVQLGTAPGDGSPLGVTLVRGVELKGRVVTPDGAPVAGVGLALIEDGPAPGSIQRSDRAIATHRGGDWATSDADGRFSVRVHGVVHHLRFRKEGFAPKVVRAVDAAAGRSLEVVLEPGVAIRGRLVRPGAGTVHGVEVVLERPDDGDLARKTSGPEGRFEFTGLARGSYQLRVHEPRFGTAFWPVEAPADDVEIPMTALGTLRGRVLDAATRQPVTSYSVAVEWQEGLASGDLDRRFSTTTGAFAFPGIAARRVTVRVHSRGYVPATIEVEVPANAETDEHELALVMDVPVRGRVTTEAGEGLASAYVIARNAAGVHVGGAKANAEGRFELVGLAPGPVSLAFHAPGFARTIRTIEARGTPVEVVLDRGLTLTGQVVLEGAPVRGASVGIRPPNEPPRTAETDTQGRFSLNGLAPGRYTLKAHAPAPDKAAAELEAEVPSAAPVRLTLARRQTAVLHGRIVGLDGEDVTAVSVTAHGDRGERATAHVASDGTFRMAEAPVGRVRVSAYANTKSNGTRAARTVERTLPPGGSAEATVEFTSDLVQGIVTRRGVPIPHVYVSFTTPERYGGSGRTDASGRYRVLGLEPGPYTVQVFGNDVSFTKETTIPSPGTLDVEVAATAATPR